MGANCKIIAERKDYLGAERRFAKEYAFPVDFLGGMEADFVQANKDALEQLRKRFKLPDNLGALEVIFKNGEFLSEIRSNNASARGILALASELLEKGNYYGARQLTLRLHEYCHDPSIQQSALFLQARCIQDVDARLRHYCSVIAMRDSHNPLVWLFCRYQAVLARLMSNSCLEAIDEAKALKPAWIKTPLPFVDAVRAIVTAEASMIANRKGTEERYKKALALAKELDDNISKSVILLAKMRLAQLSDFKTSDILDTIDEQRLFSPKAAQLLHLTAGEAAFYRGDMDRAQQEFKKATETFSPNLWGLTRLNQIRWKEYWEKEGNILPASAATLSWGIDMETKERTKIVASDESDKKELVVLLLQKLLVSQKCYLNEAQKNAIKELLALCGAGTRNLLLLYAAQQGLLDKDGREDFNRLVICLATVFPELEQEKTIAQALFGTDDPEVLLEIARVIKRDLARKASAAVKDVCFNQETDQQLALLLAAYQTHENDLRAELGMALDDMSLGKMKFFEGEALNPFRSLANAGISAFYFNRGEGNKILVGIANINGGILAREMEEDLSIGLTNNPELNKLVTLIAIDFFLTIEEGSAYKPLFETIDLFAFTLSEKLYHLSLKDLLGRLPSETEKILDEMEEETGAGTKPVLDHDAKEEELSRKKQIFRYVILPELQKAKRIVLDISRIASLSPLARLLNRMEIEPKAENISIKMFYGSKEIVVVLRPDGSIEITDQNRGIANLALVQEMNEVILDVLAVHYLPDARAALRGSRYREQMEAIYYAVQNCEAARDRKWEIYQSQDEKESLFLVRKASGMKHAFDSNFFELFQEPGKKPEIAALPEMQLEQAKQAVANGRIIVQVGVTETHRRTQDHPISEARLRSYIQRIILKINRKPKQLTDEDQQRIATTIKRLKAGELSLDPNNFIGLDPSHPLGISMRRRIELPEGKSMRVELTYVRPHLRLYGRARLPELPKVEPLPVPDPETEPPLPPEPKPELDETARINLLTKKVFEQLAARGINDLKKISASTRIPLSRLIRINDGEINSDPDVYSRLRRLLIIASSHQKREKND